MAEVESMDLDALLAASGLDGPGHRASEAAVLADLEAGYGLRGRLARLDTEKDATFRLDGARGDGRPLLVKVSQPDEPAREVACQVEVVGWVESRDPTLRVQTVVRDRAGATIRPLRDVDGAPLGLLRVQEFLPGPLLAGSSASARQLREVGLALGRLDRALEGFEHPGADRALVWDLARFPAVRPLLDLVPDLRRRALAERVLDGFEAHVEPWLATAQRQVIHGDCSPFNVVVDPSAPPFVRGFIDFGDVMRGPALFDPAVLLGNHLRSGPEHPWSLARPLLDGYRSARALDHDEVRVLVHAALARVALRALVAARRVAAGTERSAYVLEHARHDWVRLEHALAVGIDGAIDHLLADPEGEVP